MNTSENGGLLILSNQAVKLAKTNMSTAENSGCSLLRRYACYMRPSVTVMLSDVNR